MAENQSAEALYQQLGSLLANAPDLTDYDDDWALSAETMAWLGRASALVSEAEKINGISLFSMKFDAAAEKLVKTLSPSAQARQIILILNSVLARLEVKTPAQSRGAFVSAGEEFDAISAISKILGDAKSDVLFIDPYMDERALMDFGILTPEGIPLRLLSDEATMKPGLKPAGERWIAQYGANRPLSIRITPAKALHDRLVIVDGASAWILTQSFKDFAKRSHAMIQRTDSELSAMKIAAFAKLWGAGAVITES